jgi:hypothetical protein
MMLGLLAVGGLIFVVLNMGDLESFGRMPPCEEPLWLIAAFALQSPTYAMISLGWKCSTKPGHQSRSTASSPLRSQNHLRTR